MTTATTGLLKDLRFDGAQASSNVVDVLTSATVERTIEGASVLALNLRDVHRVLLRSGLFSARLTTQVDTLSFELVQVRKQGDDLGVTFEDLAVAALRGHTTPRKVAGGTMTRVDFARSLVAEEPWIPFVAPVAGERAKVELARGTAQGEAEDTWTTLGRLADEVGWRRFARDGAVWFVPEDYLLEQTPAYVLREFGEGVDYIDFDFDTGKPVATLTAMVRADRWAVPPGTAVDVADLGPASGRWIVAKTSRSLFKPNMVLTLTKARPRLPEPTPPPPPPPAETENEGAPAGNPGEGRTVSPGTVSTGAPAKSGFSWPLRGTVTSGYGPRGGRLHAGIDIAVPVGTPVGASKDGTVTFAGSAGGYGWVVYINSGGTFTRYGHLSRIEAKRGQQVKRGQRIGLSGGKRGAPGAGNSTGPHLHFEIRPGDRPANPRNYLP